MQIRFLQWELVKHTQTKCREAHQRAIAERVGIGGSSRSFRISFGVLSENGIILGPRHRLVVIGVLLVSVMFSCLPKLELPH